MNDNFFHFKLIPANHFIFSSRIPSDYMAGSFLISYLVATVMVKVMEHGGKILPQLHDPQQIYMIHPILNSIRRNRDELYTEPWIGTIPNSFKAEVPDSFEPEKCIRAFKETWFKITDFIWKKTIEDLAHFGNKTDEIWKRQMENYWEINWVLGSEHEGMLRRSLWNTYFHGEETGCKCSVFDHLQELSGHEEAADQKKFWRAVFNRVDACYEPGRKLQVLVNPGNKLSSIGLVKRLLPLYSKEIMGWDFDMIVNEEMSPSVLLLIDGDRVGEVMSSMPKLSYVLANFLRAIPCVVSDYGGRVIYAGGDESLIQAPVNEGIKLARILKDEYTWLCRRELGIQPSLSASMLYINDQTELSQSVHFLKWTLKYIAKEQLGGNSFIVGSGLEKKPRILDTCFWDESYWLNDEKILKKLLNLKQG
ncbi:type III-B CRISPR-associated protein Cas10/Cmr2 [Paenactinomyces guangxiensis]|uniref:GGDEF domain-containing protein n=1 Tax=Paenactinomyces guangxiensis TaxID=1490290 RepID=A0A7W1WUJ8_9BACL|nr:type III-B CRISPR-associated protein Cas10/Cmr2 [Paenactinomyces guangxiensis]MBA4496343.1 hypothetical protein [Paenactinomyces guangxiensis]MBH8593627.1 hypothetical protein [Paenactinomyces guangxiensis]